LLASGGGSFQCWGVCSSRVLQPSKENRTKDRCRKLLFSLLPNSAGFCQLWAAYSLIVLQVPHRRMTRAVVRPAVTTVVLPHLFFFFFLCSSSSSSFSSSFFFSSSFSMKFSETGKEENKSQCFRQKVKQVKTIILTSPSLEMEDLYSP